MDRQLKCRFFLHSYFISTSFGFVCALFLPVLGYILLSWGGQSLWNCFATFMGVGLSAAAEVGVAEILCFSWLFIFPVALIATYLVGLVKKNYFPFWIVTLADAAVMLIWCINALCTGNDIGFYFSLPDLLVSGLFIFLFTRVMQQKGETT